MSTLTHQQRAILRWHGVASGAERDAKLVRAKLVRAPICDGRDWVLVLGGGPRSVADELAGGLGRRVMSVADPAELLGREQARSALVVARASDLGHETLLRLQRGFDTAGVSLGFVTGHDDDAIAFMAAKLLADRPRASDREDLLIGLHAAPTSALACRQSLERDLRLLSLLSHSEGAHCLVDGVVLCGLHGRREHRGTALEGGCSDEDCKRRKSGDFERCLVRELRCEALLLCCCSGLTLAGETYGSDSSIALAAIDGYPRAILAQLGSAVLGDNDVRLLHQLLLAGVSFGELCRVFNHRSRAAMPTCCSLVGDPLASLVAEPVPFSRLLESEQLTQLPAEVAGAPSLLEPELGRRVSFLAHPQGLLVHHPGVSRDAVLAGLDRSSTPARLRELVTDVGSELPRLRRFVTGLPDTLGEAHESSFAEVHEYLRVLELLLGRSTRVLEILESTRLRTPAVDEFVASFEGILAGLHAWIVDLVHEHLLAEDIGDDRLFAALSWGLEQRWDPTIEARCPRCECSLVGVRLDTPAGRFERLLLDCPNCGLVQCRASDSSDLWIAGRVVGSKLSLLTAADASPVRIDDELDTMIVQHRDIIRKRSTSRIETSAKLLVRGHDFALASDAGRDLHSLKLVRVRGLSISYSRTLQSV